MGRTPPRSCSVWGVVGAGEAAAHQCSRNEGIVSGIAVISGVGRRLWLTSTSRTGRSPTPSARWPVAF